MKVAIYARYSSDNQRDASIADQLRICREFALRQGWQIANEYSDHAVSGATLLRSGFQAMMQSALRKEVAGVTIVTLAEGDITFLHIGLKGTMNAMFLKELAAKRGEACADASKTASPVAVSATAIASCGGSKTAL
jgi:site-specific DNA recombinase